MQQYRKDGYFCEVRRLMFSDCDYTKNMKLSSILRFTAEIAGADLYEKGISHQHLWDNGMVFLVSRIAVNIEEFPRDKETIEVATWENSQRGASFNRGFKIRDEDGNVKIDAMSAWVLVNPQTRHILRPSAYPYKFNYRKRDVKAKIQGKFPMDGAQIAGKREIHYSDIDANGHVYNAVYADIACDYAPQEVFDREWKAFQINFIAEAKKGDVLEIHTRLDNDRYFAWGMNGDKSSFEFMLELGARTSS